MKKNILVLVDFQNDFVAPQGALTIDNPNLIERVQTFNNNLQKGMFEEIIVTADNHFHETYDLTPESDNFPIHCVHGSWGWKLAVEFKKNIPVNILYKNSTNIWNEAPNYKMLQKDWSDCNVYIAGVLSDICVKQAMEGFLEKGANVILFEDLTQGLNQQTPEIIAEPKYEKYIEKGALRNITTAQFFRQALLEKKQMCNRVISNRGF